MTSRGDDVPQATGARVALIVGHSLPVGAFDTAVAVTVEVAGRTDRAVPVTLLDAGGFVVLHRHGVERFTPAHALDHHAHVRALCAAGADRVLALASTGSLRRDWPVGTVVAPDDFLAPQVAPTFHSGALGHRVPGFDAAWRADVVGAWQRTAAVPIVDGGTYAQTPGPRFETPAEVRMLAAFADVVGMTLVGECVLAAEAGLRYAAICVVDNLANGLAGAPLTFDDFAAGKAANEAAVGAAVTATLAALAGP